MGSISYGEAKAGKVRITAVEKNPAEPALVKVKAALVSDGSINGSKKIPVVEQTLKIVMEGERKVEPMNLKGLRIPQKPKAQNKKEFTVQLTRNKAAVQNYSFSLSNKNVDRSGGHDHVNERPAGTQENGFVQNFSDELIEAIASTHCKEISPALQLRSVGGAMNRIDAAATAFAHRSSELLMISATFIPLDATVEQEKSAMIPWNTIAPFTNGAYVNFFSTATEEDVALVYPTSTYERLAEIKKQYDPQNVFNRNYNIKPV